MNLPYIYQWLRGGRVRLRCCFLQREWQQDVRLYPFAVAFVVPIFALSTCCYTTFAIVAGCFDELTAGPVSKVKQISIAFSSLLPFLKSVNPWT